MAQSLSPQNNLPKRLFINVALLDFCRMSNVSDADIDHLYSQIEKLNDSAFTDEKAMDTVIKYNLDSINSRDDLKERLQQIKSQIADRIFEYYKISENPENVNLLTSAIFLAGANKPEAKILARAICEKKLNEPFKKDQNLADRLVNILFSNRKKLQENLYQDFQIYNTMHISNPIIESIRSDIIEYTSNISRKYIFHYTVPSGQKHKDFRQRRRDTFGRENGIRENFVKLIGLMANNGMNMLKNKEMTSNFDKFQKVMRSVYGESFLSEIDKTLGIDSTGKTPEELDLMRKDIYNKKSKEMYVKMMAGLLSNKLKFNDEINNNTRNYTNYIDTIEQRFIKQLETGFVNVRALCFEESDSYSPPCSSQEEFKLYKQSIDDTAEKQIASVHHKLPIGAAYDIHDRLFSKSTPEQKEQLSDELVNNLGNLCFVLGKKLHQSLEARGNYVMTSKADNSIFTSEFNPQIAELTMPEYLKNEIAKISKSTKVMTVNMAFSDFNYMGSLRQSLQPEQASVPIEQKYSRYSQ